MRIITFARKFFVKLTIQIYIMKETIKEEYLAPDVMVVRVNTAQSILEQSFTGISVEQSGENDEISW